MIYSWACCDHLGKDFPWPACKRVHVTILSGNAWFCVYKAVFERNINKFYEIVSSVVDASVGPEEGYGYWLAIWNVAR